MALAEVEAPEILVSLLLQTAEDDEGNKCQRGPGYGVITWGGSKAAELVKIEDKCMLAVKPVVVCCRKVTGNRTKCSRPPRLTKHAAVSIFGRFFTEPERNLDP